MLRVAPSQLVPSHPRQTGPIARAPQRPVRLLRGERSAVLVAEHQAPAVVRMRVEGGNRVLIERDLSRPTSFGWPCDSSNKGPSDRRAPLRQIHVGPSQTEQLAEAKTRQGERNHRSPIRLGCVDQALRVVAGKLRLRLRLRPASARPDESGQFGGKTLLRAEHQHAARGLAGAVATLGEGCTARGARRAADLPRTAWALRPDDPTREGRPALRGDRRSRRRDPCADRPGSSRGRVDVRRGADRSESRPSPRGVRSERDTHRTGR